jgi:SPW repeat
MVGDSRGHERARPGGASASWSPRTTLGRCWRSRAVALLGGWLTASPWALASTEDTTSLQSALVSGSSLLLLAGWALLSREPWLAHLVVASIGIWLLLAPSFWYFTSRPASWNSIGVGLATLVLATWTLVHGPRQRPPFDPHDGHAQVPPRNDALASPAGPAWHDDALRTSPWPAPRRGSHAAHRAPR